MSKRENCYHTNILPKRCQYLHKSQGQRAKPVYGQRTLADYLVELFDQVEVADKNQRPASGKKCGHRAVLFLQVARHPDLSGLNGLRDERAAAEEGNLWRSCNLITSENSKKSPNVYKSCTKMIPLEKLQNLPKNVGDLDKIIVATGFEKLPKGY